MTGHEPVAALTEEALADLAARAYYGDHGVYPTYHEHGDAEHWAAVGRSLAAHVARATADAEIVRAEWERQYDYAAEAAERFRKQAAEAETRLAAVSEAVEPVDPPMGTRDALASRDGAFVVQRVLAALDSAPTTDADGRDERRDGAGGTRWGRG